VLKCALLFRNYLDRGIGKNILFHRMNETGDRSSAHIERLNPTRKLRPAACSCFNEVGRLKCSPNVTRSAMTIQQYQVIVNQTEARVLARIIDPAPASAFPNDYPCDLD
jgi:hypothetical protein